MKKIYFFTFTLLFYYNLNAIHLKNGTDKDILLKAWFAQEVNRDFASNSSTCKSFDIYYPRDYILTPKSTIEINYNNNKNDSHKLYNIEIKDQNIKKEISDESELKPEKYFLISKIQVSGLSNKIIFDLKEISQEDFFTNQCSCIIL